MPSLTCGTPQRNKTAAAGEWRRRSLSVPNSVKLSVADTGPGIPAEYHIEVFDDFFRLPQPSQTEGMGLGLAIARRLVNAMGGKIWVESEPGGGCKFSLRFPLKPVSSANHKGQKKMSETAKILLVDDEPGMLRYIRTLLEVMTTESKPPPPAKRPWLQVQKGLAPGSRPAGPPDARH